MKHLIFVEGQGYKGLLKRFLIVICFLILLIPPVTLFSVTVTKMLYNNDMTVIVLCIVGTTLWVAFIGVIILLLPITMISSIITAVYFIRGVKNEQT